MRGSSYRSAKPQAAAARAMFVFHSDPSYVPKDMPEETVNAPSKTRPLDWLNRLSPQAVFVLIVGIFGLALAFITPPTEVPDELAHWYRIYQLSTGQMFATRYGGFVPDGLTAYELSPWQDIKTHPHVKILPRTIYQEFKLPLHEEVGRWHWFPNTALYSIVPYAPQTLAMLIARKMQWAPLALLYAGRVGSVLGYLLVGWAAIRITPIFKWPACLVMTHPMALFLAGSVSADPLTTAFTLLAMAVALWCIYSKNNLSMGTIIALTATMIAVALCKSAYAPVVLLVFAVPRDKWGPGYRRWVIPVLIVVLTVAVIATWSSLVDLNHVKEVADTPAEQMAWLKHHPMEYVTVVRRTIVEKWSFWIDSLDNLGWFDTPLQPMVSDFMFITLGWIVLAYDEPLPLRWPTRFFAGVAFLACFGLIITGNYLVWNKVGADIVEGLQGRYFLPCILLFCLIFHRQGAYPVRAKWMLGLIGALSTYTVLVVVERYYLPVGFISHILSGS